MVPWSSEAIILAFGGGVFGASLGGLGRFACAGLSHCSADCCRRSSAYSLLSLSASDSIGQG